MGSDGFRGCQIPGVQGWRTNGKSKLTPLQHRAMPRVCLFPSHVTAAEQKGKSLLSYLLSEQKPTEGPEKPGRTSPQWAQALQELWPVEVLRTGLRCPCASSRITITAAIPQLCCHHHGRSGHLLYQPAEHTALTVPSPSSITTQQVSKSAGSGAPPTTSCATFDLALRTPCA